MMRITKGSLVTLDFYTRRGTSWDYWMTVEKNDCDEWRVVQPSTGYEQWVKSGWLRPVV